MAEWRISRSASASWVNALRRRVGGLVAGTPLEQPAARLAGWLRAAMSNDLGRLPPMAYEPGHFYSPIPSIGDIQAHRRLAAVEPPTTLPCIDLRLDDQRILLEGFRDFYRDQPFSVNRGGATRYWFDNPQFKFGDGLALYCLRRQLNPNRIIEVGAGFSSCVILDTCERFLGWRPHITLVEPHPDRLFELVKPGDLDRCLLLVKRVQDLPVADFLKL